VSEPVYVSQFPEYKPSDFWIDYREVDRVAAPSFWEIPGKAQQLIKQLPMDADPEFVAEVREAAAGRLTPKEYTTWDQVMVCRKRWPRVEITGLKFTGFGREILVGPSRRVPLMEEQY